MTRRKRSDCTGKLHQIAGIEFSDELVGRWVIALKDETPAGLTWRTHIPSEISAPTLAQLIEAGAPTFASRNGAARKLRQKPDVLGEVAEEVNHLRENYVPAQHALERTETLLALYKRLDAQVERLWFDSADSSEAAVDEQIKKWREAR